MTTPEWFQIISTILIGTCIGSFLNVVIVRLPRGRSIVSPGSRTFPWRSSIPAYQNIPVLSYLLNFGRDRKSGWFYSIRYLVIEILTPTIFLALYFTHGWSMTALVYALVCSCLIAASFIDLDLRIIPDSLTIGVWFVAILAAAFEAKGYPLDFQSAVFGSIIGYGSFWLLSRSYYWITGEDGLGGADVKLMGFIGAVVGWKGVIVTVLVASLSGALVGLFLMMVYRKGRRFPIPFGPFLAAGAMVSIFRIDVIDWLLLS